MQKHSSENSFQFLNCEFIHLKEINAMRWDRGTNTVNRAILRIRFWARYQHLREARTIMSKTISSLTIKLRKYIAKALSRSREKVAQIIKKDDLQAEIGSAWMYVTLDLSWIWINMTKQCGENNFGWREQCHVCHLPKSNATQNDRSEKVDNFGDMDVNGIPSEWMIIRGIPSNAPTSDITLAITKLAVPCKRMLLAHNSKSDFNPGFAFVEFRNANVSAIRLPFIKSELIYWRNVQWP